MRFEADGRLYIWLVVVFEIVWGWEQLPRRDQLKTQ